MSIEWKNPPSAKRGRGSTKWSKIAEQLRQNPNEWAKVGQIKHASQASIIAKNYNLKVVTRKNENGLLDVYAMSEAGNG